MYRTSSIRRGLLLTRLSAAEIAPTTFSNCYATRSSSSAFIPSHPEQSDAIQSLVRDHRQVSHMLERLIDLAKVPPQETSIDHSEKRKTLEEFIKQLSIHSHVEELHVYPMIRDVIKDGPGLIDRSLTEHREVKQHLYELDQFSGSLGTNPKKWPPFPILKLEALRSILLQHIQEEEEEIFPKFQKNVSAKDLFDLAVIIDTARTQVPTRPHPSAPDAPPFMTMAKPVTAAMDKAKDVIRDVKERITDATSTRV